jgi:hypothetical protein
MPEIENKQTFEERAIARTTGSQVINSRVIASNTKTEELLDGMILLHNHF